MSQSVRVRFAPSPTGKLHVGGARTALFNWAYARKQGGTFLLRVEDTDEERSTKEFEVAILEGLRWLGIDWDEGPDAGGDHGPYYQSERRERHDAIAAMLFEQGLAYRCFCTSEELSAMRDERMAKGLPAYDGRYRDLPREESDARAAAGDPFTLRFRVPDGVTAFKDHIRGDVRFDNKEVEDWVMVRTTGAPTYNFVVVCDDADMKITHVLRGEEHLTNTPKQILLFEALGKPAPEYAHLPLMLGTDKKKLSKRTGDTALQDYREKGFPKEAIVNFLCLQGWALDGETEVFSVAELADNFEIDDVSKGGAVFDIEKFEWLAGEWIRRESVEELGDHCAPFVVSSGMMSTDDIGARREWYLSVVKEMQERLRTYAELPAKIAFLFAADDEVVWEEKAEKNARKHEAGAQTLRDYIAWISPQISGGTIDADSLRDGTKAWVKEQGLKFPGLFQPLRLALSGQAGGPDLFSIISWLGTDRTLARLNFTAGKLS